MQATHFTAAQIAAAIGVTRQRVRQLMRGVAPSGVAIVSGNTAEAWSIDALAARITEALALSARQRGYTSAFHLLSAPAERWQPSVPLARVHPEAMVRAAKMRDALSASLPRYSGATGGGSMSEILAAALAHFRRVMGNAITPRHVRNLLNRTIARDRGFEEWNRVELYLEERPALTASPTPTGKTSDLPALRDAISAIVNPAQPTRGELELIWGNACEEIARVADLGITRGKAIAAAVSELARAPGLCGKSVVALDRTMRRRLERWEASGGEFASVQDGRRDNAHVNGRLVLTDEDRKTIVARALQRGGGLSQAWRELINERALSPELLARLGRRASSKSYVPASIRERLQNEVDTLQPWRRGPRAAALAGAHINRDPDSIASGSWMQADDTTLPVYWYTEDDDGAPRIMRGQWLLMIDVRSMLALGFVLIPERNYSAFHIRNLFTQVADEHGLPREGYYLENGPWKTARLLKGRHEEIPWANTERGLRDLGLRFVHARYPRGKVVERVLGSFQNLMEGDPGYVGRAEMTDRFERVQRSILDIRAGKLDPKNVLWSEAEWYDRLTQLCHRYNEEPQQGKYHAGRSPREVYEKAFDTPLVKLTPQTRYLMATHRMREKITGNGLRIQFGREVFRYKGEATGRFIGREVQCYFNPESPDTLSFEEPNGSALHTVEREITVPAMDAPRETLAAARGQNEAHNKYARELYRAIAPRFSAEFAARRFRFELADYPTVARGNAMIAHQAEIRDDRLQDAASDEALHKAASRLGLRGVGRTHDSNRDRQRLEGLRELGSLGIGQNNQET